MVKCYTFGFKGDWLLEHWLQRYIRENASKYGLEIIKQLSGRGGGGGDFLVKYKGKVSKAEVEWNYDFYNHFKDSKYDDVEILICLDLRYPKKRENLSKYPPKIIYIRAEDFSQWYFAITGRKSRPYLV